ncbi:hypothetical protein N7457_001629 [Penicillium paradoxum]|uniref:uncharacterized protein n=1 Tax=Penicillium paradoxum TaxID=176176 RepID=UPI002549BBAD|nr:uncharacterized protein N7457_001629 [Penicillium paradoxum]KAJ5795030.1 hypothetical protein N7457_001629 [Penicillium paradoxum]
MASGSCACQYIRYTASNPPTCLVNCHCTTCRKQAGAPYQSWAFFATDDIKWHVNPKERRATHTATRSFCPRCGSTLSMILDRDPKNIGIAAGTLDEGQAQIPLPSDHIFLSEKASWFELADSDAAKRWDKWGVYAKS